MILMSVIRKVTENKIRFYPDYDILDPFDELDVYHNMGVFIATPINVFNT